MIFKKEGRHRYLSNRGQGEGDVFRSSGCCMKIVSEQRRLAPERLVIYFYRSLVRKQIVSVIGIKRMAQFEQYN